jgi:hypothetical protein
VRRAILAVILSLALPGAALVVGLALPGAAAAQSGDTNPLSPGLPVSPAPTPTATAPPTVTPITTPTSGGSLSGGGIVAIAIGALVILGGISLYIWRDARRRAPARHRAVSARGGEGGRAATKRVKPRKLSPAERRRRKRGRAR